MTTSLAADTNPAIPTRQIPAQTSGIGHPAPRRDLQVPQSEEWRPVVGWEGVYEVSDQGRVKSLHRGRY